MTFCPKCGTKLVEGAKYCPKCGMAVDSVAGLSTRESLDKPKKKPISNMAIVLIVIVVAVVIAGLLSTVIFLGGWHPFGEVIGSDNLVTKEEFISDFTSVDARSGFNVEISKSNSYNVLVTADDNVMEYIEIKKSGDTLMIGVKWGYSFRSVTLNVEITMPELHSLELSGGAQGKLEEFSSTSSFSLELSGGSILRGEFETSGDVEFDLSGGSQLLGLVGEANDLTIDASSGSQLGLSDFTVHNTDVELSGGSLATINLNGRLNADLSGGSTLSYIGDPTLGNIETSGGSIINKNSQNFQEFSFEQWFSDPNQYNDQEITIDGYYFTGFEIIVLSENLYYTGYAQGHLWPTGRMLWIEGGIPLEIYDSLYQQEMIGPTERYGQIRIKGKFEFGGEYGHLGQYNYQIVPT